MILRRRINMISSPIIVLCSEVNDNREEKIVFPSYIRYCHVQATVCRAPVEDNVLAALIIWI